MMDMSARVKGVLSKVCVAGVFAVLALFLTVTLSACGEDVKKPEVKQDTPIAMVEVSEKVEPEEPKPEKPKPEETKPEEPEPEESEEVKEKRRQIEEHLRARYKIDDTTLDDKGGTNPGIELTFTPDGFLKKMVLRGEFTPPSADGPTSKELSDVAYEFFNKEKEFFGLDNLNEELVKWKRDSSSSKVVYFIRVEGISGAGGIKVNVLEEDGKMAVRRIEANFRLITPEMLGAIKRYKAKWFSGDNGTTSKTVEERLLREQLEESVLADLAERGMDREHIEKVYLRGFDSPHLIDKPPYLKRTNVSVCYSYRDDRGHGGREAWEYGFDAITGEVLYTYEDLTVFEETGPEITCENVYNLYSD